MLKSKNINMTDGPLFGNMIFFALPIVLTNFLQLLFNAADIIVVGQFCGSVAVAAVGSTGALVNLLVNIIMGLSVGTGIVTAQSLGAKDNSTVIKTVHTAIPVSFIIGLIIAGIGVLFSKQLLFFMNTPKEILPLATVYLRIYFLGVVSLSIYNFGAAILRAGGDTKSPLIYLTIAGILNVILNIILVAVFKIGVVGVAIATSVSQTVSAILVIRNLMEKNDACRLILKKLKIYMPTLLRIIKIGVPTCIKSSMFSISNVIIQSAINSFGAVFVTGNAAAGNIEGFVFTAMTAFSDTALNFTGQNIGANNFERTKRVFKLSLFSVTVVGFVLGLFVFIFSKPLLSIYITDSPEAIEAGILRITLICLPYFICGLQDVMSGALCGMGATVSTMIISILSACGFRLLWIFTIFQIPQFHTPTVLFLSYPITWTLTGIAYAVIYIRVFKRLKSRRLK